MSVINRVVREMSEGPTVHNDSNLLAMLGSQDVIQKCSLSSAQISYVKVLSSAWTYEELRLYRWKETRARTGDYGDGNFDGLFVVQVAGFHQIRRCVVVKVHLCFLVTSPSNWYSKQVERLHQPRENLSASREDRAAQFVGV